MKENEKAIYLELDKNLWFKVGVHAAVNNTTRKDVVTTALSNLLNEKEEGN